ncbi:uncharacterized protein ACJ7VT_010262 [Polymixia lowei]
MSTEKFFTTSGDGKTYLKIAPGQHQTSAIPPAVSEKTFTLSSDFSSKAVMCLIEAVGRRRGLYETRGRSQLFQSVQEEMATKGHVLPVEKIRRKWNNLIVTYKRVKDRSRETGHAKTSWEFFDMMDATLSDTVGAQIINNKNKIANTISTISVPLAKIAAKPQVPEPTTIICPHGDFATTGTMKSVAQVATSAQINIISNTDSSTANITTLPITTIAPGTNVPDLKPLILLNSDIVATGVQPATFAPSPSSLPAICPTRAPSPSSSRDLTSNTDHKRRRCCMSLEVPNNQNLPDFCSSFPGTEGQNHVGREEQRSASLLQEILRRQGEQARPDRVGRHRAKAREKRRERREVRMVKSLGRIATALELLSSKQDTVVALLQRLADRK